MKRTSEVYGKPINFLFGDWTYMSNILTMWSKSPSLAAKKYPVVCLFAPFDEDKTNGRYSCTTRIDLLIATQTKSEYTNEQRIEKSFVPVLRPIYEAMIEQLKKHPLLDFDKDVVAHTYSENMRYGSRGVMMSDGKPFNDYIDGIDIKSLFIKIKKYNCRYGKL